jgi:hypothetical protein
MTEIRRDFLQSPHVYNNNNNNNNELQLGYHPVAVVILHVHKYGEKSN